MISRHPKNIAQLLRGREGRREAVAALAPAASVIPGENEASDATNVQKPMADLVFCIGGGALISVGIKLDLVVDFDCTVIGWTMLLDIAATMRIDLWKDTYGNYPPVAGDTMPGASGNRPQTVAALKAVGSPSAWTKKTIVAGETIRVNVDTNDLAQRALLVVKVRRD